LHARRQRFACGMSRPTECVVRRARRVPGRNVIICPRARARALAVSDEEAEVRHIAAASARLRSCRRGCAVERLAAAADLPVERFLDQLLVVSRRTCDRPPALGGVSITEMSRKPASDICSVRGCVALRASTSTSSRSCAAAPSADPNAALRRPSEPELVGSVVTARGACRSGHRPSPEVADLFTSEACGTGDQFSTAPVVAVAIAEVFQSAASTVVARASAPACR